MNTYNYDTTEGQIFYFVVQSADDVNAYFQSHYFNITSDNTTTSSTTSSAATSSGPTTSPTGGLAAGANNTQPTARPNGTMTESTFKVALGVGLGVGIPIVFLLLTWIALHVRRQRQKSNTYSSSTIGEKADLWGDRYEMSGSGVRIHEACNDSIKEAPADYYHRPSRHEFLELPSNTSRAELRNGRSPVELGSKELRRFSW